MQPINYNGQPVALAGEHQFWLVHPVERLPDGAPVKKVVVLMCAFARDVLTGEMPSPYTNERAERFAREVLLPAADFLAASDRDDIDMAIRFNVPLREIIARRRDLGAYA